MPSELEGLIFPYFFAENRILGCLGGILCASWTVLAKFLGRWAPKTLPRCATWAPRRPQDATKTYPRAAQNTSQDALGSRRAPRTSKTSKMTPKSRWGTPRGLVFGAYLGAFGTVLARILEHFCTSSLYHLYLDVVPSLFTFFNILEALLDCPPPRFGALE